MTKSQPKADWHNIDPASLPKSAARAYETYKQSYAETKSLREAFEASVTDVIKPAPGKRVIFGYNFGKLSVAIVDDDRTARRPSGSIDLSALVRRA